MDPRIMIAGLSARIATELVLAQGTTDDIHQVYINDPDRRVIMRRMPQPETFFQPKSAKTYHVPGGGSRECARSRARMQEVSAE